MDLQRRTGALVSGYPLLPNRYLAPDLGLFLSVCGLGHNEKTVGPGVYETSPGAYRVIHLRGARLGSLGTLPRLSLQGWGAASPDPPAITPGGGTLFYTLPLYRTRLICPSGPTARTWTLRGPRRIEATVTT